MLVKLICHFYGTFVVNSVLLFYLIKFSCNNYQEALYDLLCGSIEN